MRRFLVVLCGVLLPLSLLRMPHLSKAQDQRCFEETGYCISGPIRAYWEANGGLPVFGYPITAQAEETVEDWTGPVQWFERDRLEDHDKLGVMAGRLGARILELQGRPWQTFETVDAPEAGCRYFSETRHSMCEPFKSYWEQNGGLPRFGYPVTEAFDETIDGWTGSIQYFERRRMEHHLEYAGTPYEVLLGLLGNELKQRQSLPITPEPDPYPGPAATATSTSEASTPTSTVEVNTPTSTSEASTPTSTSEASTPTSTIAPEPPYQPGVCLTATEAELGRLINDYRAEQDLPPVALSLSLSHVAQVHVVDLHENRPDTGTDSRGMECNLHSWSDKGDWTPVCYTSDHRYAERMWIKPWEITKEVYSDNGFEIASKGASTAAEALDLWKQSPGHNNMIIEAGNWGEWQAMGVGFYEEYAVVWFGEQEDPQGTIPVCK